MASLSLSLGAGVLGVSASFRPAQKAKLVRHHFTKGHGAGVGAEGVLLGRHGFGDSDGEFAERAEMLRILGGGCGLRAEGVQGGERKGEQKGNS